MVARYYRNGNLFSFYLNENENHTGYKPYITMVKTPSGESIPETIVNVPVEECDGYRIKINKKSITAANGARGAFSFIRDCIHNDFMMVYVYKICETFLG